MRVLFWGTPTFALPALRALGEEGHDVMGVVTQPDRPAGRGRELRPSAVKREALSEGIPVFQPERASDPAFLEEIRALEPEISVVVAYGQILRQEVLDLPRHGSVNIHASLLPELRGAAPIHWAIIRGYLETGISIMRMEAGLDSGPVLLRVPEPIRADQTTSELTVQLAELGAEALVAALMLLEAGEIDPVLQEHEKATHAPKIDRETARLDWSRTALETSRWIRGLDDAPGAWTTVEGGDAVKLFRPRVEQHAGAPGEVLAVDEEVGILVAAGDCAVRVREVQPAGRRRMEAGEWIRGRGIAAGQRLV